MNARKPRAVRINFNCACAPRFCIGHADITDDRLAKFLCDAGYTVAIDAPGQGMTEAQLAADAQAFQRSRRLGPYKRRA